MGRGRGGSIFAQARAHPRATATEKAAMTRALTRREGYTRGQRGVQTKAGRVAGLAKAILGRKVKKGTGGGARAKRPVKAAAAKKAAPARGRAKTPAQKKAGQKTAKRPKKG